MQLKSLQLFMDVVETGSFVSAAARRHTVQSNVTAHIKKLEDELGTLLFHRKGGARLTTSGKAVAEYAAQILKAHDNVLAMFNGEKSANTRLKLGAMETTTAVRLPGLLSQFHQDFPHVQLTLETSPSSQLVQMVNTGEVDGAFVGGKPKHSQLHSFPVFTEKLMLIGPSQMKTLPSAEDFINSTFLTFRQGCSYRQRVELLLSACQVNGIQIFEFGSIDGILGCVAAGMGYTLMPESVVHAHQHRFHFNAIDIDPNIALIDTFFVTNQPKSWSPALSRFIDALHRHTQLDNKRQ